MFRVSRLVLAGLVLLSLAATALAQRTDIPLPTTRADVVRALTPTYSTPAPGDSSSLMRAELIAGALVAFDPETGEILPESFGLLDIFGVVFKEDFPDALISVAGHVGRGLAPQDAINLSLQHAETVKDFLVTRHGLDPNRFLVQGYGDMDPLPASEGMEQDALNNRIEFLHL